MCTSCHAHGSCGMQEAPEVRPVTWDKSPGMEVATAQPVSHHLTSAEIISSGQCVKENADSGGNLYTGAFSDQSMWTINSAM